MNRIIFPLRVCTTEGNTVVIETPDLSGNDYSVEIPVDQIDILIEWLQEAKKELSEKK